MVLLLVTQAFADAWDNVMTNEYDSPIVWSTMPVPFEVNGANTLGLDPDGVVFAAVSAAGAWLRVEGTEAELNFTGSSSVTEPGHDGVNSIFFTTDWESDSSLLALTTVWSETDGNAVGFDIRINARHHAWTLDGAEDPEMNDLQNTLTHELGHAMGFGHLEDVPSATMYPSASAGETGKRDLDTADMELAIGVYPDGTVTIVEGEPYEPLAAALCGTRTGAPLAIPSLLVAATLLRRRSARETA